MLCRWKEKTLHHDGPTLGAYNWTEIERYDTTDLQLLLKDLQPATRYEILLQAYNQFGRGPVAKIEADTAEKGTIFLQHTLSLYIFQTHFFQPLNHHPRVCNASE